MVNTVVGCAKGARADLRAAALNVMAALACHTQLLPQLLQGLFKKLTKIYRYTLLLPFCILSLLFFLLFINLLHRENKGKRKHTV